MHSIKIIISLVLTLQLYSQQIPLPPRPTGALNGDAFAESVSALSRVAREEVIFSEVLLGNIPDFLRTAKAVSATVQVLGVPRTVTYFVIPEYLSVGHDTNYFLMPMTPLLAQRLANTLHCVLPTKRMVDQIYAASPVKLRPQPIPPTPQMTTVPVFKQHNDSVRALRTPLITPYPLGSIVGGTKKDVIISNAIYNNLRPGVPKPVVIYGWHQLNGSPIQPVYNGHEETYADYSHGIRLVLDSFLVDGQVKRFQELLNDPILHVLLSDEGMIPLTGYSLAATTPPVPENIALIPFDATSVLIKVQPSAGVQFKAYYGYSAAVLTDSSEFFSDSIVLSGVFTNLPIYCRVRANDSRGYSVQSELLAAVVGAQEKKMLFVQGYDRAASGNAKDFIRLHVPHFKNASYTLASCTNEAMQTLVSLDAYAAVIYMLGLESTADETFSAAEQQLLKVYLQNGGMLFVSGAEIAWDLDYKGSQTDRDFCRTFLKVQYANDAPGGVANSVYSANAVIPGIFQNAGTITYDNGTYGTYNVSYPDVFLAVNGSAAGLYYGTTVNQIAAVQYAGLFPGGVSAGKVITMGFPFETIYPAAKRDSVAVGILQFFELPVHVNDALSKTGLSWGMLENYPNPFNAQTTLRLRTNSVVNAVQLAIYSLTGELVFKITETELAAGVHDFPVTLTGAAAGIYYARFTSDVYNASLKLVYLP